MGRLSPIATRLLEIILEELTNLYDHNDPLTELRNRNVSDPDIHPVPPKGNLFTLNGESGRAPSR
jgi:hypothetical protein